MIDLCEHIEKVMNTNIFRNKVYTQERHRIVRLSTEFKREFMDIAQDTYDSCSESTQFSDKIKSCLNTYHLRNCRAGGSGPTTQTLVGPKILPFAVKVSYFLNFGRTNNCLVEAFLKWSDQSSTPSAAPELAIESNPEIFTLES